MNQFLVSDASYFEKKLLEDLFKDYRKGMRPVLHDNDTVMVTIGLSLNQIIDVVSMAFCLKENSSCRQLTRTKRTSFLKLSLFIFSPYNCSVIPFL